MTQINLKLKCSSVAPLGMNLIIIHLHNLKKNHRFANNTCIRPCKFMPHFTCELLWVISCLCLYPKCSRAAWLQNKPNFLTSSTCISACHLKLVTNFIMPALIKNQLHLQTCKKQKTEPPAQQEPGGNMGPALARRSGETSTCSCLRTTSLWSHSFEAHLLPGLEIHHPTLHAGRQNRSRAFGRSCAFREHMRGKSESYRSSKQRSSNVARVLTSRDWPIQKSIVNGTEVMCDLSCHKALNALKALTLLLVVAGMSDPLSQSWMVPTTPLPLARLQRGTMGTASPPPTTSRDEGPPHPQSHRETRKARHSNPNKQRQNLPSTPTSLPVY